MENVDRTGAPARMLAAVRRWWLEVATLAFVVVMMGAGTTLPTAHAGSVVVAALHVLFLSTWKPFVSRWTVVSAVGLLGCVAAALRMLRRPSHFGWWALAVALVSRIVINVSRRGPAELAYPFTGPERHDEYIAAVPLYRAHPLAFLRDYPHLSLPEHPAGHPPGATMLLGALAQLGLPGAWPEVGLVLAAGAATAPLTWLLARELLDDDAARTAAVLWIFAPSVLIESATSVDAVYALVAAGIAFLLLRGRSWLGGAAAAAGTFLSYALAAVPVWAVAVIAARRGGRAAVRNAVAMGVIAVVGYAVLWATTGYDPIAAYHRAAHRYYLGAGRRRPYRYWVFADVAAFGLGLGLPTLLGAARGIAARAAPALAVAGIVAAGALSGYTKGEVERIWLFMTPLAAIAAAPAVARWPAAPVVAALAAQALAVEVLFRTPW